MKNDRCVATSAPRQQQIEGGRGERGSCRPFLDRRADGKSGDQRQQRPDHEEHDAGDDRHVIAGDRQHMTEAGNEHGVVDRRGDGIAAAGQERGRNGALIAVKPLANARIDGVTQVLHEGGVAQRNAAALGWFDRLDRAGDKAGGGDVLEEHVAREIVGARPQRRERRLQAHLQLDETADIGRGAFPHREPHAIELA
jgi:hypothetical protein